jgi:hypothetical protein
MDKIMTESRLRKIVAEIKKIAEGELDNVVVNKPPANTPNSTNTTATTPAADPGGLGDAWTAKPVAPRGGGGGGNVNIMAMQQALQDLAQAVSSQINLQDAFSGDPRKEKEAKARDAFGVFLAKNYMRNTKVPGVEFDPNPKVTDVSQKRPDDPTRMSVVMDTMNRIGYPKKGEKVVDGAWGPRTNAAVRDAYAFASGLLDFVDDVNRFATKKMQITSYDRPSLAELEKAATPNNTLTPQQKIEAAPVVTQHVKAIKKMYDDVKKSILQHPAYQQFIEDSVPFKSYKSPVTPEQVNLVKQNFTEGFTVDLGAGPVVLPVDSLLSLNALKKMIPEGSKVTPEDIVSQIWKQQEKLLGKDLGF